MIEKKTENLMFHLIVHLLIVTGEVTYALFCSFESTVAIVLFEAFRTCRTQKY